MKLKSWREIERDELERSCGGRAILNANCGICSRHEIVTILFWTKVKVGG